MDPEPDRVRSVFHVGRIRFQVGLPSATHRTNSPRRMRAVDMFSRNNCLRAGIKSHMHERPGCCNRSSSSARCTFELIWSLSVMIRDDARQRDAHAPTQEQLYKSQIPTIPLDQHGTPFKKKKKHACQRHPMKTTVGKKLIMCCLPPDLS